MMNQEQFRSKLGEAIKARSVQQVAAEVGITRTAIYRWIEGQSTLSWPTIEAMADAVGLSATHSETYSLDQKTRRKKQANGAKHHG